MYAITTKYHGPTNTKGARISASAEECKTVYVSYPYDKSGEAVHRVALAAFLANESGKNNLDYWDDAARNPDNWWAGWIEKGYAFVFVGK